MEVQWTNVNSFFPFAAKRRVGRKMRDAALLGTSLGASKTRLGSTTYAPSVGRHIPALDGVRGLALLLVLFIHLTITRSQALPDRLLHDVSRFMWSGVDLFFVLSGFLITGILFDSKESNRFFRNFYTRRTLRIFPLYYAVIFMAAIVIPMFDAKFSLDAHGLWNWTYLQNIGQCFFGAKHTTFTDVTWSLAIEEQYYLVWPLVVFCLGRRALMRAALGMIVAACVCRAVMMARGSDPYYTYMFTISRLDGIALGSWIALAARSEGGLSALVRPAKFVAAGAMLAITFASIFGGGVYLDSKGMQTVGYPAFAFLYGSILVLAVAGGNNSIAPKIFSNSILRWFGKYSYALYLFHYPICMTLKVAGFTPERFPAIGGSLLIGQCIFYVVVTGLSIVAALASWHLFEKHFLRLRDRVPTRAPAPIPVPTVGSPQPVLVRVAA
jgi:peptidoglycan/LPS O-acetylase OafA/YrhL